MPLHLEQESGNVFCKVNVFIMSSALWAAHAIYLGRGSAEAALDDR